MELVFCLVNMVSGGLGWIKPRLCDLNPSEIVAWPAYNVTQTGNGWQEAPCCADGIRPWPIKSSAPKLENPQPSGPQVLIWKS
jgi:hypothetical protein